MLTESTSCYFDNFAPVSTVFVLASSQQWHVYDGRCLLHVLSHYIKPAILVTGLYEKYKLATDQSGYRISLGCTLNIHTCWRFLLYINFFTFHFLCILNFHRYSSTISGTTLPFPGECRKCHCNSHTEHAELGAYSTHVLHH